MDRNQCISLIGMPAAGKSTIGVLLAKQLARPFVDTDLLIQAGTGRTLQEIINADGVEAFEHLEEHFVCSLPVSNQIIATGGSVVYSERAMRRLSSAGPIVYLTIDLEGLLKRIGDMQTRGVVIRPGETLADLYAQREPLYTQWADVTVQCEHLNHQGVVDAVIDTLS